jgi:hypothetical protein
MIMSHTAPLPYKDRLAFDPRVFEDPQATYSLSSPEYIK